MLIAYTDDMAVQVNKESAKVNPLTSTVDTS